MHAYVCEQFIVVVYSIVWLHSYSCPDLLGFCARMRSSCSLPYSCLFPFFSPSLSSCNCMCTPHFLRLVCPCLCHEHTQYWRRGLVNFHASLCKTMTRTLNFLQIRRREGWPRSGLLSRVTPALETGRLTRNDWRCFSTQMLWLKANRLPPCLPSLVERPTRSCEILLPLPAPRTRPTRS